MREARVLSAAAALFIIAWPGCVSAAELSEEEQAILAEAERYQHWPDEEDLPVPPDGWYQLELGGETIDVFRDEYGIPHVFAESVEGAFRGQGYVIAEDRCRQLLSSREAVMGRRAAMEGPGALGHDIDVRVRGYPEAELEQMITALRPDQRAYLDAYVAGANAYLRRYAPQVPPVRTVELPAGAVYHLRKVDVFGGGDEHRIAKLLTIVQFLHGEKFMRNVLNECLPLDVPNAPTTDHSHLHLRAGPLPQRLEPAEFHPGELLAILEEEERVRAFARADGQFTKWGSQVWTVGPERSATGRAMLFAGPMIEFCVPARAAQVHLVAPVWTWRASASSAFPVS